MTEFLDTPQGRCRFGVTTADITPPVGIYHRMWGAATHERATGVHRPLVAAALVFRPLADPEGEREQVLVVLDHCLLFHAEMDAFLTAVAAGAATTRERLSVSFTHTHGAGLMSGDRSHLPGGELIAPYLEQLTRQTIELIQQSRHRLQPATLIAGVGRCPLAAHRDFWDAERQHFVCGFNPAGTADDTVLVVRVASDTDATLATLVNYACHPTTLAWENTLISPDFPGAMREVVEQSTRAPCVFLQGASGDLGPREGFVGDPAIADRNGRQLGHAVLAVLESLPPARTRYVYTGPVVSGATLGTWQHQRLDEAAEERLAEFQCRPVPLDFPYRQELPTSTQTEAERQRWQHTEAEALRTGDMVAQRDAHAMVERMTRQLARLAVLPRPSYPFEAAIWRIGGLVWVLVEGEPYSLLQRELRRRCPERPILVLGLVNGARCSYLPTADVYGQSIYQESIALLAPGSLERLVDVLATMI